MARDLTIHAGHTFTRTWYARITGAPIDTAVWGVRAQARADLGRGETGDLYAEWSTSPTGDQLPIAVADAPEGQYSGWSTVVLSVPADVSAGWTWRKALWDIEAHELAGATVYPAYTEGPGTITVIPEVVRGD